MPLSTATDKDARFYWILLIPAGLLTAFYSILSAGAAGFFGAFMDRRLIARLVVIHALSPFPLFLFVFVSLRLTVCLLWLCVACKFILDLALSRFHFSLYLLPLSVTDWGLITAAVLTHAAYLLKKRSQHASREKADRDTQVTN